MPSAPKMLYLATAREGHAPDGTQITNFSGRFIIEHKEELQKITDKYVKKIDKVIEQKTKELMTI